MPRPVTLVRPLSRGALLCSALLSVAASCDGVTGVTERVVRSRWSRAQDGRTYSRPAVLGDVVFFATGDGRVIARDRATGAERWSAVVAGGSLRGGNLVVRGGVVVASAVQHAVGLDAATGRELWRYVPPRDTVGKGPDADPGQFVANRVDADDGAAYLPAWGASVSAVDLHTGAVRWVWEPGVSAGDTAASGRFRSGAEGVRVSGDTAFATVWHNLDRQGLASEAWLVALDRATGGELCRVVIPRYAGGLTVQGAPAFFGNLVVFTTLGGRTWAVDRKTRALAWQFVPPARYATSTQVEISGGVAYVDGGDDFLYALDAATGAVRWKADAGNGATRDLLVTDRRVYYPTYGTLRVLDRATGRGVATARVAPDGHVWETAAVADRGRIFITTTTAAQSFDEP